MLGGVCGAGGATTTRWRVQGDREGGPPGHHCLFRHPYHHPLVTLLSSPLPLPPLSPAPPTFLPPPPLSRLPLATLSSCTLVWCPFPVCFGLWRARPNRPYPLLPAQGQCSRTLHGASGKLHLAPGSLIVSGVPHKPPSLSLKPSPSLSQSPVKSLLWSVGVPAPVSPPPAVPVRALGGGAPPPSQRGLFA